MAIFHFPIPNLWQPLICFPFLCFLSFQECYINGIIQYMTLWDDFLIQHNSLDAGQCISGSFLLLSGKYLMAWV